MSNLILSLLGLILLLWGLYEYICYCIKKVKELQKEIQKLKKMENEMRKFWKEMESK